PAAQSCPEGASPPLTGVQPLPLHACRFALDFLVDSEALPVTLEPRGGHLKPRLWLGNICRERGFMLRARVPRWTSKNLTSCARSCVSPTRRLLNSKRRSRP